MTRKLPMSEVPQFQRSLGISPAPPVSTTTKEDLPRKASQSRLRRIGCDVCALCSKTAQVPQRGLTMRLSDAGLRRRPTKLIYPDHRLPSLARRSVTSVRFPVSDVRRARVVGPGTNDVDQRSDYSMHRQRTTLRKRMPAGRLPRKVRSTTNSDAESEIN